MIVSSTLSGVFPAKIRDPLNRGPAPGDLVHEILSSALLLLTGSEGVEVAQEERKVAQKRDSEFLKRANEGSAFPTAGVGGKAELPHIACRAFSTKAGVRPRVAGFAAEDSECLSSFFHTQVRKVLVLLEEALESLGGGFDIHVCARKRRTLFRRPWETIVTGNL
jgi:hypothetical protein